MLVAGFVSNGGLKNALQKYFGEGENENRFVAVVPHMISLAWGSQASYRAPVRVCLATGHLIHDE